MKYMKTYESFSIGFGSQRFSSFESFRVFARKRFTDEQYTDEDFEEIIKVIEDECSEFINEVKSPIFRGAKNVDETYTRGMGVRSSRTDRIPLDTKIEVSEILDDLFEERFNIRLRSNGVFTSKLPNVASDYGRPYLFFPIGDYKYFWNQRIKDLYGDMEGEPWYYNNEDDWQWQYGEGNDGDWCYDDVEYDNDIITAVKRVKEDNPELANKSFEYVQKILDWKPTLTFDEYMSDGKEELIKNLEGIVSGYEDSNIDAVIDNEITFVCDKYYLVDPAFYDMYLEYLDKKNPV